MSRSRMLGILVVAAVALSTGFLVAGQVKAKLLTPFQPGRQIPGSGAQRPGSREDQ